MATPPFILLAFANDWQGKFLRNISAEQEAIRQALQKIENRGFCKLIFINDATIDAILEQFRDHKGKIKAFHYGGHGEDYALLLNSATKEKIHAEGFARFLAQQPGLELIFLNGCVTDTHEQALEDAGIRHIIITSENIEDEVARDFAKGFYQSLAIGSNVRECFEEATGQVIARKGSDLRGFVREETEEAKIPWKLVIQPEVSTPWKLKVKRTSAWVYAAVVSILVFFSSWTWITYGPESDPFDFTLIIQDEAGNPLPTLRDGDQLITPQTHQLLTNDNEKGRLGIRLDGETKWGEVNSLGNVYFRGIDHHFYKKSIPVTLESQFWQLAESSKNILLKDKSAIITLKRTPLLCTLDGKIEFLSERPLSAAKLEVRDLPDATKLLAKGNTQQDGTFRIPIDPLLCKRQYVLDISHPDYSYTIRDTLYPESGPSIIRTPLINPQ